MNNFVEMSQEELIEVDGGAIEILICGKVLTGAAACGVIGLGGLALVGVGALGWYVMSKN